jgi:hypothetical protein
MSRTASASSVGAAAAGLLLAACSSFSVDSNYDPQASFEGLRTYAWREPVQEAGDPLALKLIRDAADAELGARGYAPAAAGPDFTIGALVVVRQKVDVQFMDDYWGYSYRYGGPHWSSTYVTTYDEGSIVLDIASGATGEPMWRGSATGIVDTSATPEERQQRIREAVSAVLAEFPPKK